MLSRELTNIGAPNTEAAEDVGANIKFRRTSRQPQSFSDRNPFIVQARFEGRVLEVTGNVMTAHLVERSRLTDEFVVVDIPVRDVPPHDSHLIYPGAVFYWLIGYEQKPYWQRSMILSFAGQRSLTNDEIRERKERLLELLRNDED
jgi:hypothetical protein